MVRNRNLEGTDGTQGKIFMGRLKPWEVVPGYLVKHLFYENLRTLLDKAVADAVKDVPAQDRRIGLGDL